MFDVPQVQTYFAFEKRRGGLSREGHLVQIWMPKGGVGYIGPYSYIV